MGEMLPTLYIARHGETAWSLSGQHTGLTDLPLTERGQSNARRLGNQLRGRSFAKVADTYRSKRLAIENVAGAEITHIPTRTDAGAKNPCTAFRDNVRVARPTPVQVLTGAPPANTPAVKVEAIPGVRFKYSGGGYEIIYQLVLDVAKEPFPEFIRTTVLQPLGMNHSTAIAGRVTGKCCLGNLHRRYRGARQMARVSG